MWEQIGTVIFNMVSLFVLLLVAGLFYLATVMDRHERDQRKVDKRSDS
jgi:hypothetical protein